MLCLLDYDVWSKIGAPGDLGRRAIYFQELGSSGNYFEGFWEQVHILGFMECGKK